MHNISCIGWPNIDELWRMKITNISALALTDLLVEVDTTFHNSKRGKTDGLDENYGGVQGKGGKEKLSSTIERRQGGGDTTEGHVEDLNLKIVENIKEIERGRE